MAELSIHDSEYFLKDLEKNFMTINTLLQRIVPIIERSYGLCRYFEDKCQDWRKEIACKHRVC